MSIADWTSNRWTTVFTEDAEKMLGSFERKLKGNRIFLIKICLSVL